MRIDLFYRGKRPPCDKKRRRKKKVNNEEGGDDGEDEEEKSEEDEDMESAVEGVENLELKPPAAGSAPGSVSDSVFTVTVAQPNVVVSNGPGDTEDAPMELDLFWPSKRMNTSLAVSICQLGLSAPVYNSF